MSTKRAALALHAIEGELLPEEQTYQASLRNALYSGVSEADVAEIVKGIVGRAKDGDVRAQKMFFDYILGAKSKPATINVTNNFANVEQAAKIKAG